MPEQWNGLWGHIEDLRKTLIQSCFVIFVGFLFLLIFYQPILDLLVSYPRQEIEGGLTKQTVKRIHLSNSTKQKQLFKLPPQASMIFASSPIKEGNQRAIVYEVLPGESILYDEVVDHPLLVLGPIEGMMVVIKTCFWLSFALTAPIWGWIWLKFILPGLERNEKAILFPFLSLSLISLILGCLFAYCVTVPLANGYLFSFNQAIGQNEWTLKLYVDYVLLVCLGHAIAAEIGLLLFILIHFQAISTSWLIKKRRYMIVLAFILGALLTPPDVLTQLLMAFPLMGLYEAAILYGKWRESGMKRNSSRIPL